MVRFVGIDAVFLLPAHGSPDVSLPACICRPVDYHMAAAISMTVWIGECCMTAG